MSSSRDDLSPEDRAFLDLARDADDPSAGERDRVRMRIAAKLGVAATAAAASKAASVAASTSKAAAAGSATLLATPVTFAVKIAAVVMLVGGAGGTLLYESARRPTPSSVSVSVTAPATVAAAVRAATVIASVPIVPLVPTETAEAPPSVSSAPSGTVAAAVPARPTPAALRSLPVPIKATGTATLEDETRLVQSAIAALRSGDPASGLSRLDEHAREFPHGVLAEERSGERVLALCALGREAEARATADRFLIDYPNAPLAGKVRASCAGGNSNPR